MKKYIYETENLPYSMWTGKAKKDYFQIINDRGEMGWRFVAFLPAAFRPKGVKGTELIFERVIEEDIIGGVDY